MQKGVGFAGLGQVIPLLIAIGLIEDGVVFGVRQHGVERGLLRPRQRLARAVFRPHVEEELANLVAAGIEH